jgi:hypothetical protein
MGELRGFRRQGGFCRVQEAGFRVQELQKAESRQQKAGTAHEDASSPRTRGSKFGWLTWIPAFAGMTIAEDVVPEP